MPCLVLSGAVIGLPLDGLISELTVPLDSGRDGPLLPPVPGRSALMGSSC